MPSKSFGRTGGWERTALAPQLWTLRLNLVAAALTIGILALSVQGMWNERQEIWHNAGSTSRGLLSTLVRNIGGELSALDASLKRVVQGFRSPDFGRLAPEVQHRMLFDEIGENSLARTLLLISESGALIADGGPVIAPRDIDYSDFEFFTVHREQPLIGLHISRPYRSRIGAGDLSVALSRRVSDPDGRFAGVVAAEIPLSNISDDLIDLTGGRSDAIALLRSDGVVLARLPQEPDIGRDISDAANLQRFRRERDGSFEDSAAMDGIHRLHTFSRVNDLPLILVATLSTKGIMAPWWRRTLVAALVTSVLCGAVARLMILFRRELGRRTRAEEELARLARADGLTGLPNRRAFDKEFDRDWQQAIQSGSPLSLLFIDVDHFKGYNDEYGHAQGDEALRAIAGAIGAALGRHQDLAARYGGEEFTVLLPRTDPTGAVAVARAIRDAIIGLGIEHKRSSHGIVTISVGVATAWPRNGDEQASLLEAADRALYDAKRAGRNRFCVRQHNEVAHGQAPLESAPPR